MSAFSERCKNIESLFSEINMPELSHIRLCSMFLNETVVCFKLKLPISCIIVSSSLIERTLFVEKNRRKPPEAGSGLNFPNLSGLFKLFIEWDVLLENLLDDEERLDLKLRKEKGQNVKKYISNVKYIETRNAFAHGKSSLVGLHLAHLLPDSYESETSYDIDFNEFINPSLETVSYVHLTKTLRFMKAYSSY